MPPNSNSDKKPSLLKLVLCIFAFLLLFCLILAISSAILSQSPFDFSLEVWIALFSTVFLTALISWEAGLATGFFAALIFIPALWLTNWTSANSTIGFQPFTWLLAFVLMLFEFRALVNLILLLLLFLACLFSGPLKGILVFFFIVLFSRPLKKGFISILALWLEPFRGVQHELPRLVAFAIGYVLTAVAYACVYSTVYLIDPDNFFQTPDIQTSSLDFPFFLYFSFGVITTSGAVTPVKHDLARFMVATEQFAGLIWVAIYLGLVMKGSEKKN